MNDSRSTDVHTMPPRQGLYDPAREHDACGIGFVAHLHGTRSRDVVQKALQLLENLTHRGAVGADPESGDGAGMLLQVPHAFLRRECAAMGIGLPEAGSYGVGMLFLPSGAAERRWCEQQVERCVAEEGCRVLGWRDVPVEDGQIGPVARRARPCIRQLFVTRLPLAPEADDSASLERALYRIRKRIEAFARAAAVDGQAPWYVASLSSRTVVYKGMLRPYQLGRFYRDLADERVASGLAIVHSRFSTNTFPSWPLAHPYRLVCHNGEINTIRGNVNWLRIREPEMASARLGGDLGPLFPTIAEGQSDSASLDNALELLVLSGRPLAQAMMMLVPEAWEGDAAMDPERRAFYDYHSSLMEAWDGPAAVVFTDGRQVGATLDRNGLRPARYAVTDDDLVILASEAGALDLPLDSIRAKGRLQPGRMVLVNTTQGRLLEDAEIKSEIASLRPYARWLREERIPLEGLGARGEGLETSHAVLAPSPLPLDPQVQSAFGYTREDLSMLLAPMAANAEEPTGSMGNDTPLAVLSERPRLLFSYFRQSFAQVTNPAIDPIRERLVMSLAMNLGPQRNLLDETPEHAHQVRLEQPVLQERELDALRNFSDDAFHTATLSLLFPSAGGAAALQDALELLCSHAADAVRSGAGILVLSDRGVSSEHTAIPSLLAVGAVHNHLVREGLRARASLVADTGEAREVAHVALLIAHGASAVCPWLALETVAVMARDGHVAGIDESAARAHYVKAVGKGLLKVLSKMGISTLQSYCGAQICEAVGLDHAFVDRWFTGTTARLDGVGMTVIAEEVRRRHTAAFAAERADLRLDVAGDYHYRAGGEHHHWNPRTIAALQHATRSGSFATFKEFSRAADDDTRRYTLRGQLELVEQAPIPIEQVEPASEIVKRFVTGAMSFGSLSREAHETLALAMNALGSRSNSGEGGEERERLGTARRSAIKQVASARFGVTAEYLADASELQIKIAQGAKPGEGGQLPGHKVDEVIARTRCSVPGVTLISPPPHHDIYSIEDLAQLIHDLRCVNPRAAISVKLVSEAGVGTVAAGVAKAHADLIVISGDAGGTGASPLSSIKHAGVPWELGLAEAQQTLLLSGLRGRVRLQTDGQLKTGRDVAIAAALGADEFGFATAPLIVEGCVMMRKCHLNTCPVGVATQDPALRAKFTGEPEHVVNYFFFVAEEVREILASLGMRRLDELVGRTEVLRARESTPGWKAKHLDLGQLLHVPPKSAMRRFAGVPQPPVVEPLDDTLLALAERALDGSERVTATLSIRNVHRAVGARLSGEVARRHGAAGLRDDSISLRFAGSAGQSFGAFAARGVSLELTGEANDYVGKGLSGGRIVVRAPHGVQFLPQRTVIIGNTALYGATSGEAFIGGLAGERFAVRNSGALAVVEGVGDHACEYMTGGVVVVLGTVGRNFAAGMSGGLAFVLDEAGVFEKRCNRELVEVGAVARPEDRALLHKLIERHAQFTGSARAKAVLAHWEQSVRRFVGIVPTEYRRALEGRGAGGSNGQLARPEGARHG